RALKEKYDFFTRCRTPELAAEITVQPIKIIQPDAAILFSDIMVIPQAMQLEVEMKNNIGPWLPNPVRSVQDVERVIVPDINEELHYVMEAISLTRQMLNDEVPLIGFAGAPWTIFSYMVEGGGSKTFSKARKMLYTEPELSEALLDRITDSTIAYLNAQVEAGADLIQVFDSWAGILGPEQYKNFSLKYIARICDAVSKVPVTVFAKGAFFARAELGRLKCETIGLDWNMNIQESRELIGPNKTLQGNLDPCVLYGSFRSIENETRKMLDAFGGHRHIANLGHGVYPDTDPEKVKCFIETVKSA
ncbi:MAG: uroporphyrinogen decarboxylase, partial [Bacteroidota bacterium]